MSDWREWPVFTMARAEKRQRLENALNALTRSHAANCDEYRHILEARALDVDANGALEDVPFLPVRLFKLIDLLSVPRENIVKMLTSSGTTSQAVSRVFLDKTTASAQTTSLVKIVQSFIGRERLPMLIVDHPGVIRDRNSFSARGAGIIGLSTFGRNHCYVLRDEDMSLDEDKLEAFLERHSGRPVLIFGFTFMIWRYLYKAAIASERRFDLGNAILIHSGGWKALEAESVSNAVFKRGLKDVLGIERVHNFYGMAEQVGSIFVECESGHLHAPAYADVIVRDPETWAPVSPGEVGLIQVLSVLPTSYPGHSLLTEDRGAILGEDDCACGRKGKYFRVDGRLKSAEVRGCSDTHGLSSNEAVAS